MSQIPASQKTEDKANRGKAWTKTWSLSSILFIISLAVADVGWRSFGYYPNVADSTERWEEWYQYLCNGSSNSVALIGTSRMQAGISPARLCRRLPGHRISQLGRNGGESPVGVLRALADEPRFRGVVLCEMLTAFLPRTEWDRQQGPQLSTVNSKWTSQFDHWLSRICKDLLAVKNGKSGLIAATREFLHSGAIPARDRVCIRTDRSLIVNFGTIDDLPAYSAKRTERLHQRYAEAIHPAPEDLDDEIREINHLVRRIQSRGGAVVFIHFPTSGQLRSIDEKYHPRAEYWDRFAVQGCGTWLHFQDVQVQGGVINCPDESHLDEMGAQVFTDAILDELFNRKIIELPCLSDQN